MAADRIFHLTTVTNFYAKLSQYYMISLVPHLLYISICSTPSRKAFNATMTTASEWFAANTVDISVLHTENAQHTSS